MIILGVLSNHLEMVCVILFFVDFSEKETKDSFAGMLCFNHIACRSNQIKSNNFYFSTTRLQLFNRKQ